MFDPENPEGAQHYVRAASSALEVLGRALEAGDRDWESVRRVLDFGCGYGRVLRSLRSRLPDAEITGCDLDPRGVWFCTQQFRSRPLLSGPELERVTFGEYDLIWVGSVFTHLRPEDGQTLFRCLGRSLAPSGLLTLSFHGAFSLEHLEHLYGGLYSEEANWIRRETAEEGSSYRPYPEAYQSYQPGRYGMAWHDLSFFDALAGEMPVPLERVFFAEKGWDDHHDVVAFKRVEPSGPD